MNPAHLLSKNLYAFAIEFVILACFRLWWWERRKFGIWGKYRRGKRRQLRGCEETAFIKDQKKEGLANGQWIYPSWCLLVFNRSLIYIISCLKRKSIYENKVIPKQEGYQYLKLTSWVLHSITRQFSLHFLPNTDIVLHTEQILEVDIRPQVEHFLESTRFGNVFKLLEIFDMEL